MMPTLLIAVDPATVSGVAVFLRGRLVMTFTLTIPKRGAPGHIEAFLRECAVEWKPLPDYAPETVLVHETWTNPQNMNAIKHLERVKWAWLDAATALGIKTCTAVNSQTWQAAMGCTGKSAQRKAMAKLIANQHMGQEPDKIDENVADAVCIGRWYLEK